MNTEKALNMIEKYILSDCTDVEWRKCLQHLKWLVVHQKELLDELAATNEKFRQQITAQKESVKEKNEMLDATISGQETLQKYHHDATEIAYKNGYKAGVEEFAEMAKDMMFNYYECVSESAKGRPYKGDTLMDYEVVDMIEDCIDNLLEELTGGSENE